jgi:hypothetical protein
LNSCCVTVCLGSPGRINFDNSTFCLRGKLLRSYELTAETLFLTTCHGLEIGLVFEKWLKTKKISVMLLVIESVTIVILQNLIGC